MTDEHDPRYPLSDKKHNPDPEVYAREYEVRALQEENDRLEIELAELKKETRDRLATVEATVKRFSDQYTLGRGIFIGICSVLGLAAFLVVGVIQDMINHIYVTVEHHNPFNKSNGPP